MKSNKIRRASKLYLNNITLSPWYEKESYSSIIHYRKEIKSKRGKILIYEPYDSNKRFEVTYIDEFKPIQNIIKLNGLFRLCELKDFIDKNISKINNLMAFV